MGLLLYKTKKSWDIPRRRIVKQVAADDACNHQNRGGVGYRFFFGAEILS